MRLGRCSRRVLRAFCVLAEPVCRVYFLCPVGVPCVRRVGAWARACSFTAVLTARNTAVRAGIAVPITRQLPRRAVTGVWTLRTPLLWLAGCSVLVVHGPGVQLFLPGVDALQAQALAAVLMEETP